ncbi:hypothetical protein [Aureivirga marina]|uniref:hypothetical protein n=1 Tax=Aureivirga marina TaxID=1182451 RepID=UPI0018C9A9D2|nr:hypothetical protein [Aureivirga marina]
MKELLLSQVEKCNSMFDTEEEMTSFVLDLKNNYVHSEGSWPNCGCNCNTTAKAFEKTNGEFAILKRESWSCENSYATSIKEYLPENFNFSTFYQKDSSQTLVKNTFYLDVTIPKNQNEITLSLKIVPFGTNHKSNETLVFNYEESEKSIILEDIKTMIGTFDDPHTVEYLLDESYNNISNSDMNLIKYYTSMPDSAICSVRMLSEYMHELKDIYDIYSNLKCDKVILLWDRKNDKFRVADQINTVRFDNFNNFLEEVPFWTPKC